jgi:hypothetical protein
MEARGGPVMEGGLFPMSSGGGIRNYVGCGVIGSLGCSRPVRDRDGVMGKRSITDGLRDPGGVENAARVNHKDG